MKMGALTNGIQEGWSKEDKVSNILCFPVYWLKVIAIIAIITIIASILTLLGLSSIQMCKVQCYSRVEEL